MKLWLTQMLRRVCGPPSQRRTNALINMGRKRHGGSCHLLFCLLLISLLSTGLFSAILCPLKPLSGGLKGWEGERGEDKSGDTSIQLWWRMLTSGRAKQFPREIRYHYSPICLHISHPTPRGHELVAQDRTWGSRSHKTAVIKVVSSFTWYGQFSLISSDWSRSHKGFKPYAQQFSCAVTPLYMMNYLALRCINPIYWFRCDVMCVTDIAHSVSTWIHSLRQTSSKLGEKSKRGRGTENPYAYT